MADDIVLSSDGITSRRGLPVNFQTPAAVISGGAAQGGIFRGHTIQFPWSYMIDTTPTDVSVGTALYFDADVTVNSGGSFQTGYFGPRGIINLEGLVRYGFNMNALNFAPVGYYDALTIANSPGGTPRTLVPSWSYLSARSLVADGAVCPITGTDVNDGGAAFVDAVVWGSTDTGQLDGTTNDAEMVSFLSMPGIFGNTQVERRIAFDVMGSFEGVHPLIPEPTGPHWSGVGNFDPTVPTLNEEIGLRVQLMTLGATKIGISTAHPIRLMAQDLTHVGVLPMIEVTRNYTLQTSGQVQAYTFTPTITYDDDSSALGPGQLFNGLPILKNVNGETRTLGTIFPWITLHSAPTFRGDGAALTVFGHTAVRDAANLDILNAGTVQVTTINTVSSDLTIGSGGSVVTRRGFLFSDATGSGTLSGTQVALDIAALAKGATNIGVRNASTYVATPLAQTLSAAGNAITATAEVKALTNSTGGSLTLTSTPTIADGQNGQEIELVNVGAQDIVIQDQGTLASSNLRLTATTLTLQPRDSVRLRFNSTVGDWVQCGPLVNVL